MEPVTIIAATAFAGLLVTVAGLLRGWQGWLRLKECELERRAAAKDLPKELEGGSPEGAARIEIADLKERIRKLEAIANGVEL